MRRRTGLTTDRGWHSAAPDHLDFETGAHNFSRIFDIAKDLGLYILFRPGPYINAETNAGGFPGWLLTGDYGSTRNNDSRYTDAWHPYFDTISRMVADHSVTNGGNVILYQIENEYGQQWLDIDDRTPNETAIHYMELLEAAARDNGINMPTIANAPNLRVKSWSSDYDINNEGGNTDIYTVDNYPSCWSCNLAECRSVNGVNPNFTTFDYYSESSTISLLKRMLMRYQHTSRRLLRRTHLYSQSFRVAATIPGADHKVDALKPLARIG